MQTNNNHLELKTYILTVTQRKRSAIKSYFTVTMPRKKKSVVKLRRELTNFISNLVSVGEEQIQHSYRQYRLIEKQKTRDKVSLTPAKDQLFVNSSLREDYLQERRLKK